MPLLVLPAEVIAAGVFRHVMLTAWKLTGARVWVEGALPPTVCETPLPANFCRCGEWMLFEEDDGDGR